MRKKLPNLMKEVKELNKWRDISCSYAERLNIIKISVLTNLMYRSDAMPTKIPTTHFVDINELILKFKWRDKRHRIANTI